MAETIKKKRKNEPDGFDRFNRVSNKANVLLNLMFLLMALVCIIPVLLVIAISLSAEASITDYGYTEHADHQGAERFPFRHHIRYGAGNPAHHADGICAFPSWL